MQYIAFAHAVNTLALQNQAFHIEPGGRIMLCKGIN